ncbi:MAG: cation-translocating P-type ATPase [Firmicutes bacterium]|nr:cation-translocating P-type ATPase [Bacillota bacterium]
MVKMKYYNLNIDKVFEALGSNENGLESKESQLRLNKYGKNKLAETKKKSQILKFLEQFKDLMIIILLLSALISFILSIVNNESFIDTIVILAIVVLNAILGFIQELKADKAIEALKKMQVTKVKVKRDNKISVINSEDVVKGDILVLEAGDTVPADARIIWQASLKVDEASLTGESVPVTKNTDVVSDNTSLSNRTNMIYSGTNIVYGKCQAVVCEIGMDTEFGLIAGSLNNNEDEVTPLQKKIDGISKYLSVVILIIIVIMFFIGVIKDIDFLRLFMLTISLAVAAIPEGLPAIITITLSLGMANLAKKNAIVRKMASVETLGCTEVICSDKTGTITQNKMKIREIYYNGNKYNIDDLKETNLLFDIMALDNDVEKSNNTYIGDPTEIAIYECCEKYMDVEGFRKNHKRIDELPFDSERKMMSTINKYEDKIFMYTKGSFDSIIEHCSHIYKNNKVVKLTNKTKNDLINVENTESNKAYRILAYACKELDNNYILDENLENDLIFVGMTAMIDPPREDVKEAIFACKSANIKPIMITGDSLSTATSIAREIGILENDKEAITGAEIDKMSEKELKKSVHKYSVYARVSPLNKLNIVKAWKENNKIVAMTGDGVNDAPALKAANIGVGMGITGTEVSKSVADIVLADDSFSTIVTAVKEGRRIFDNIRNVLVYLLAGNIAEILVVFISMLFGIEIFIPIQLLYLNLITDSLPAIALAFEKEEDNIMNRGVRRNDSSFFTPFLIAKICGGAILKTFAILLIYFVNLKIYDFNTATTMAFLTLVMLEMIYALTCRNLKINVLNKKFFDNSYMNKSMLLLIIVQLIVFLTPIKNIFNITDLSFIQFLYCFTIVIIVFLVDEFIKPLVNNYFKD